MIKGNKALLNKALLMGCLLIGICFFLERDAWAFEFDLPKAAFSFGYSTNSNIQNKVDASEVSDMLTDTGLKITLPGKINPVSRLQLEYAYKQNFTRGESADSWLNLWSLRYMNAVSKKTLLQAALLYNDLDVFLASGINLAAQSKLSSASGVKVDYTYTKRRWQTPVLNGTNNIFKLDYNRVLTPKTAIIPFFAYEKNTSGFATQDYSGTTFGLRYSWKFNDKVTLMPSYDYRARRYNTPDTTTKTSAGVQCSAANPCTKDEKRNQFGLNVSYKLNDTMNLMFKYNYYRNTGSSSVASYGSDKNYKANIFSIIWSIKSTASKSKKKQQEEE